jgi:hypothetical protein
MALPPLPEPLRGSVLDQVDLRFYCILFVSVFVLNAMIVQSKWKKIILMKADERTTPEQKKAKLDTFINWYWSIVLGTVFVLVALNHYECLTERVAVTSLRLKLRTFSDYFIATNDQNILVMGMSNATCGFVLLVLTWVLHTSKAEETVRNIWEAHNPRDVTRVIMNQVQMMSRMGTLSLFLSFYVKIQILFGTIFFGDVALVIGLFFVSMYYANALFRIVNPIAYVFAAGGKKELLLKIMTVLTSVNI